MPTTLLKDTDPIGFCSWQHVSLLCALVGFRPSGVTRNPRYFFAGKVAFIRFQFESGVNEGTDDLMKVVKMFLKHGRKEDNIVNIDVHEFRAVTAVER